VEASDGEAFIVAPLEEVWEGGDYKEAEAVEVGVKEGQDLDGRLCGEEDEGLGKGEAEFGTGEKGGGQVRRLRRRDEDLDCDVAAVDLVGVTGSGGRACTFRSRR
jgi:hypothetical protein